MYSKTTPGVDGAADTTDFWKFVCIEGAKSLAAATVAIYTLPTLVDGSKNGMKCPDDSVKIHVMSALKASFEYRTTIILMQNPSHPAAHT